MSLRPRAGRLARWAAAACLLVPVAAWAQPDPAAPAARPRVVLDPGHGGEEFGSRLPGLPAEKDLTLKLAGELQWVLQHSGCDVSLTRSRDQFVPLTARQTTANRLAQKVFVSLHVSAPDKFPAAVWMATTRFRRDDALAAAAARVVAAGARAVPWDLAQNSQLRASQALATALAQAWRAAKLTPAAVQTGAAPLAVLYGVRAPAVMVEIPVRFGPRGPGLDNDAFRRRAVEAVAAGIRSYLAGRQP